MFDLTQFDWQFVVVFALVVAASLDIARRSYSTVQLFRSSTSTPLSQLKCASCASGCQKSIPKPMVYSIETTDRHE